jgi:hypothetical protein
MSQLGADLEQLATLRATLLQQSQVIEQLSASIRNQLAATDWQGPAADRLRGAWSSEHEPSLRRLQAALQDAGAEVGRRREALLQAGT